MSTFFKELTSFSDFALFSKDDHYQPVPDDWWVIITDVKGSTQAVREGRYRDVNTLGAATIVAATRAALTRDFPFVFGGDGATLLVPPEYAEEVKARLLGLKALARENFALDLRVGAVLVEELTRAGKTLEVGRFALNPVLAQATIRGAGLIWAEHLIKSEPERYEAQSDRVGEPDLASLSCRWQPIPSQRGQVLALLVQAREGREAAYEELLTAFAEIFPAGLESLNPAQATGRNAYHTTVENLRGERRYHTSAFSLSFIRRALFIIVGNFIIRSSLTAGVRSYVADTASHSDFRKFDETLRMVIDCTEEEIDRVHEVLDGLYRAGKIAYGTHVTSHALMTCFVESLQEGGHMHFLDAQDGGYTAAAVQLKQQLKEETS